MNDHLPFYFLNNSSFLENEKNINGDKKYNKKKKRVAKFISSVPLNIDFTEPIVPKKKKINKFNRLNSNSIDPVNIMPQFSIQPSSYTPQPQKNELNFLKNDFDYRIPSSFDIVKRGKLPGICFKNDCLNIYNEISL